MIVDPDFLDHWRTRMLVDLLADEMAPIYLLRLWSHCQNRKQTEFKPMPDPGVKALCRYPGDAGKLVQSLTETGFVQRLANGALLIVGWAEKNAQLIAAWDNGSKGGRPKKNPTETHGKPSGNPAVTDERGEERRGEEKISPKDSDRGSSQGLTLKGALKNSPPAGTPIYASAKEISVLTQRVYQKSGYTGDDGALLWRIAALHYRGLLSESDLWNACDKARQASGNRPAYLRKVLTNELLARGLDFPALLDRVKVTPECPKTAPMLEAAR